MEFHVSTVLPPETTLAGVAVKLANGPAQVCPAGQTGSTLFTDTVTLSRAVPPLPVQVSVYVVFCVSSGVCWLPCNARAPLQPPEAVHDCALLTVQLNVEIKRGLPAVGSTFRSMTGDVGVLSAMTETLREVLPPVPLHCSVYVRLLVMPAIVWLPVSAFVPLQDPDAVQLVALLEDQLSTVLPL